jgi:hypothetical protein
MFIGVRFDLCTKLLTVALLIIEKDQKHTYTRLMEDWQNKLGFQNVIEYYVCIKMRKMLM